MVRLLALIAGMLLAQPAVPAAFNVTKLARRFALKQTAGLPAVPAASIPALPRPASQGRNAALPEDGTDTDCSDDHAQDFVFCLLGAMLRGDSSNATLSELRSLPGYNESAVCDCSSMLLELSGSCSRDLTTEIGNILFISDYLSCNAAPGSGEPCGGNGKLFQDFMACSDANGLDGEDVDFELGSTQHQTWCSCTLPLFDGIESTCGSSTPMGQFAWQHSQNATVQTALHACPGAHAILLP